MHNFYKLTLEMEFKILSYNVNFALNGKDWRSENVVKAIIESDADVVCLQETHRGFEKAFAQLGYPYSIYYHHQAAGGQGFLSRYPIIEEETLYPNHVIQGSWFPIQIIKIQLSNEKIVQIVGVHLRPPINEDLSANLFTARNTNTYRLQEIEWTINQMGEKLENTIFIGDFNQHESAPATRLLIEKYKFTDALEQYVPQSRETHRWRIIYNMWLLKKRLDHIIYSEHFKCKSCRVIDGYEENASDHQPVLATLEFK